MRLQGIAKVAIKRDKDGRQGGEEKGTVIDQDKDANVNSTKNINTVSPTVNVASIENNAIVKNIVYGCVDDPNMLDLEEIGRFSDAKNDDSGANINNSDTYFQHPRKTRRMTKNLKEHGLCSIGPSWIVARQEELLQFKLQEVWTLVDLPNGKRAIGNKWVFGNKKDERGIVIKNKARLVAQGYTQEEGIDYDKVLFLILVKSTLSLRMQSEAEQTSTPMETHKPLLNDENGEEMDVYLYRSMIGSLMYLTSSRPDIMFAVCACARYQVNPKVSHLHVVKRIFRYLKGQPKLGLWFPKYSPFDLVAASLTVIMQEQA
ncbi:putative ribonuclease H-like domain-containing protein [Tanacetum coccineum]